MPDFFDHVAAIVKGYSNPAAQADEAFVLAQAALNAACEALEADGSLEKLETTYAGLPAEDKSMAVALAVAQMPEYAAQVAKSASAVDIRSGVPIVRDAFSLANLLGFKAFAEAAMMALGNSFKGADISEVTEQVIDIANEHVEHMANAA